MKTIGKSLGILTVCSLLMVAPLASGGSHYPSSITIVQGTQVTGDVGSLSVNDAVYLQVNEVNIGTELDRNPNEQWLVYGTQEFGSFATCIETKGDSAYCSYWEEDDGGGDPTGNSLLLTPTGVGTYSGWTMPMAGDNWQMVDDDPPHDANTTYVYTSGDGIVDTYVMEDIGSLPVGQTIAGTMTAFMWSLRNGITVISTGIRSALYVNARDFQGDILPMVIWPAYKNHSYQWATNPDTGLEWTEAELNAMELGMRTANPGLETFRTTSVGAVVPLDYLNEVLDLRMNTTLPTGADYYNVTITANWDDGANPAVYVSVWDFDTSNWVAQPALTITDAVGFNDYTETLTVDEISPTGEVRLKFDDFQALGDTVPSNLSLDWVNVHATYINNTATVDLTYTQVDVPANTQGELILVGYRDGDTEAITLQVYRGASWTQLGADIFTSARRTTIYPIDVGNILGGMLRLRVTDSTPTDNTQTSIYLDYVELNIKDAGGGASPVFPDFDTEYDWWSGKLTLTDHSFSIAGDIETYNWRVDGQYVGNTSEIRIDKYPSWFDVGQHEIEVTLEVVDEMGYAGVESRHIWVDNSMRLVIMAIIFLLIALVLLLVALRLRLVERIRGHRRRVKFKTAKRKDHGKDRESRIPRVR